MDVNLAYVQTKASLIAERKSNFQDLVLTEENLKNGHKRLKVSKGPPTQGAALAVGRKSRTMCNTNTLLYY